VSVRIVLAVALAAALLATSVPAIDQGRVAHSDAVLDREADRLATGVAALAARSGAGGRWIVAVRVPARSWGHAGGRLVIDDAVRWRAAGGRTGTERLPVPVADGIELTAPGRHRLAVRLVERDDGRAIVVRRLGFKSENATTPAHVRPVHPRHRL